MPHLKGMTGAVFAAFSSQSTIGVMISLIGHLPDVIDILMNCRIKKIVRKKMIRLTKIV